MIVLLHAERKKKKPEVTDGSNTKRSNVTWLPSEIMHRSQTWTVTGRFGNVWSGFARKFTNVCSGFAKV